MAWIHLERDVRDREHGAWQIFIWAICIVSITISIDGLGIGGHHAYAQLPVTGPRIRELDRVDDLILGFMNAQGFKAGTVAIMKGGRLVFRRGYGWQDEAQTQPIHPDAMMRIASNTIPLTAAGIRLLEAQGQLSFHDTIVDLLNIPDLPGKEDDQGRQITIKHILDNESGLPDQIPKSRTLGQELGLNRGATFGATRPCGPTGIGGCDAFMKLCLSSSGCESRPAKGEPARVGSKPCASSRNGVGDA